MRLVWKHLTEGLIYARCFRLIPSLPGTIVPFFWQLVNLYGTLPAVVLILGAFQIPVITMAAIVYPLLSFKLDFSQAYCLSAAIIALAFAGWQAINISANRRVGFKLVKLQFSTRTALLLLGLLLTHSVIPLPLSPRTTFWDLHFKPHLAGRLPVKKRTEIIAAIKHDYLRAAGQMGDAIFFGCSPGSFRKLLIAAGLPESRFIMIKTIIPPEHARIFNVRRPFYFYVIFVRPEADRPDGPVPRGNSDSSSGGPAGHSE